LKWQVPTIDEAKDVIVVVFDMCSSTRVIEALTLLQRVDLFKDFLSEFKHRLAGVQHKMPFLIYKFVGDGWVLLYPPEADGALVLDQLSDLCRVFRERFQDVVLDHLDSGNIEPIGLTFGIDVGKLLHTVMFGRDEYIGRPINIASRLQSATKTLQKGPSNMALVSNTFYKRYLSHVAHGYPSETHTCSLPNVQSGGLFFCRTIDLMPSTLPVAAVEPMDKELAAERRTMDLATEDFDLGESLGGLEDLEGDEVGGVASLLPEWMTLAEAASRLADNTMSRYVDASQAVASSEAELESLQGMRNADLTTPIVGVEIDRAKRNHAKLIAEVQSLRAGIHDALLSRLKSGALVARAVCESESPGQRELDPGEWDGALLDLDKAESARGEITYRDVMVRQGD
jgi:class 3 adenylate cyclase